MKRFLSLTLCLAMVAAASVAFAATSGTANGDNGELRQIAVDGPGVVLTSSTSSALAARETAGPDTFALYGGPDAGTEGKFQLANGVTPSWDGITAGTYTGGAAQWTPVDLTQQLPYFHVDTFNAANLNNHGAGNKAMWSGIDASDSRTETWDQTPPFGGYGNSWNDALLYESSPVADNTVGQTVSLDFFFNLEVEFNWDFFNVEYDSAGTWTNVAAFTGTSMDTNLVFQAPGVQYSTTSPTAIVYSGNDYGGDAADQIRIRLIFNSDGGWSDEDGLNPTLAGAVQVDDISLSSTVDLAPVSEDFEGAAPYLFNPVQSAFVGDFAEVYGQMTDLDPCRDNLTPVMLMIDSGQIIRNGPGIGGETSIVGGSTSPGVTYGVPGNYVTNYNGGLSFGELRLTNEVWSPPIAWDYPGVEDEDVAVSGAFIRWTSWVHLPLANGMFYVWHVRSKPVGEPYGAWADRNFVYYGGGVPGWGNYVQPVTDLLLAGPEFVQIALGTWDYASLFGLPGNGGTPSPAFDNVAFYKYRIGGPSFASRDIDLANDGFPVGGSIDVSTQATRDALDIPFNMTNDVDNGDVFLDPGDSIIVNVASAIPGATVTDVRMFWALSTNALFEDAIRSAPASALDVNVVAGAAGTVWTGEVVADTVKTSNGTIVDDRYFFDLPDADFIYPGDVLHYYIQASDSDGRVTTFPGNTNGFLDFSATTLYARGPFTVRGLPSITDAAGTQPRILVWNDFGNRGGEPYFLTAFNELGYAEGSDYDTYTTNGPSSLVSNGLGSAGGHGANADQLAGYFHMFYFAGNLSTGLLSNGSGTGRNDKGNDIGVLQQWHDAVPVGVGGARNVAYFGDYVATSLAVDSAEGLAYLNNTMGVDYGDADVRNVIGGQTAPAIVPNAASTYASTFATDYVAYGGCLGINQFDQIQPMAGAEAGHLFTTAGGVPIAPTGDPATGGVASVINATTHGIDITFPYASFYVYNPQRAANLSARTLLFQEILSAFAAPSGGAGAVAAPKAQKVELSVAPNPFNPQTTVKFTAAIGAKGSVKVFNLRGELVKTLHNGEFQTQTFTWDGTDNRGASVASGVYVIQAQAGGNVLTKKAALVK